MGVYKIWWIHYNIYSFLYGSILWNVVDDPVMKTYFCFKCDDRTDNCTACVFDTTPENFDKSIMNVFCRKAGGKPVWKLQEATSYYYETF